MELTPELNLNLFRGVMKSLIEEGLEGFVPVFQALLNEAMKVEREEHLKAKAYERTHLRSGHANGYKDKTIVTRSGPLELRIPQVRDSSFYPHSIEKGTRSEVSLKLALAEMYVQGVSTRKVQAVTEQLCGMEISATQVSRVAKILDDELEKFRKRPLIESYPYVYLDAHYQRIRYDGVVRTLAVLSAIAVNSEGRREVIGVSVSLSEAEVHWRKFLQSLAERGLKGVQLFISDDHVGLKSARQGVFPSIPWQRCQFHLAQNSQAYAPNLLLRREIGQAMRDIFNCPSLQDARAMINKVGETFSKSAPDFVKWLYDNIEEGLAAYQFPRHHWKKIRTSNSIERLHREIRRRTKVATLFPNQESCLRLVSAVLQEIHQEWVTGKLYVNFATQKEG